MEDAGKMSTGPTSSLRVIALVSGGKDSFYSLLHCIALGHRVVALANVHPPDDGSDLGSRADGTDGTEEREVSSFMYQTVGHQVVPLQAEATGIPLYRQAIVGGACQQARDYWYDAAGDGERGGRARLEQVEDEGGDAGGGEGRGEGRDETEDETESMIPLLRAVMAAHPEADALCAGAILSTYQRTRVESVATRLGLVPLAYLWKYPDLPAAVAGGSGRGRCEADLLADMAAAGLDVRMVKVASGGLDESFLWTNIVTAAGRARVGRCMRRFGHARGGAVLGEGGEFETLVVDGPPSLFRQRIVVDESDRRVVREGSGSAWLSVRNARLEAREAGEASDDSGREARVRKPDLLDARFVSVLSSLGRVRDCVEDASAAEAEMPASRAQPANLESWSLHGHATSCASIQSETAAVLERIRQRLDAARLSSRAVLSTTILLRRMADFAAVNTLYGALFEHANPPARVTVSCGQLLPSGSDLVILLSVLPATDLVRHRDGLHVQSRSYWAPANIGPYSQAIAVPASLRRDGQGPQLVTVAGQIPLLPSCMTMSGDGLRVQLVLSLQHLWRIGREMGVRWWGSVVAYLPPARDEDESRLWAGLAGHAWEEAHLWFDGHEHGHEHEHEHDAWDLRFDARVATLAAHDLAADALALPDWDVLAALPGRDADPSRLRRRRAVPPLFVAHVAELPRGAPVEWHVHAGFARTPARSVDLRRQRGNAGAVRHSTVVNDGRGRSAVQTVVATSSADRARPRAGADLVLAHIDARVHGHLLGTGPWVPCRSLWDARGNRLASVSMYYGVYE